MLEKIKANLGFLVFIISVAIAINIASVLAYQNVQFPDLSQINDINLYVAFSAMFLASFARLYVPIMAKKTQMKKEGKPFVFDNVYLATFTGSLIVAMIITTLIFLGFTVVSDAHPLVVFAGAGSYAFGQAQMINQIVDWIKEAK